MVSQFLHTHSNYNIFILTAVYIPLIGLTLSFISSNIYTNITLHTAMESLISVDASSTIAKTTISKQTDLTHYPSNEQGYGVIQIDKVLNFATASLNPINLFVMGSASNSSSPDKDYYAQIKNTAGVQSSDTYTFTSSSTQDAVR